MPKESSRSALRNDILSRPTVLIGAEEQPVPMNRSETAMMTKMREDIME
jgi:hypothetical protein